MTALILAAVVLASPSEEESNPRVPLLTSSAAYERKPKMVLLFRRYDAFFPAYCVAGGKLRAGDRCLSLMPRKPTVRLMDGRRVELLPLARHGVSAWDAPERKGWALPESDAGAEERETELAVWPPDANPGLEPAPNTTTGLDLEGLRALPEAERLPLDSKPGKPKPTWPPRVAQAVMLPGKCVAAVLSGVRRGLYVQSAGGTWREVRPEGAAEVGTTIVGRADLDGDGRAEWIVHILGWNEFGLEVRPEDFGRPLFEFNDCGV